MPGIIVLVLIALTVYSVAKRANNTSKNRPGQTEKPQVPPRPRYEAWREAFPDELREILGLEEEDEESAQPPVEGQVTFGEVINRKTPERHMGSSLEGESYQDSNHPDFIPEGESRWDPDGCIGGSLPHEKAHAPTRVRQAHAIRRAAKPVQATAAQSSAPINAKLTPEQLRSAVVMAEILGRPVALRRRPHRL